MESGIILSVVGSWQYLYPQRAHVLLWEARKINKSKYRISLLVDLSQEENKINNNGREWLVMISSWTANEFSKEVSPEWNGIQGTQGSAALGGLFQGKGTTENVPNIV